MKCRRFPLLLSCWLAVSPLPAIAEESPSPGGTKWDLVKEYLHRRQVDGKRGEKAGNQTAAESWAVQAYKLEHHGYAPYEDFVILDLIERDRKTKIVGYLPSENRFCYLSPSTPKPVRLTIGKTRVSRNGSSFKVGSSDGADVLAFFDSTDEVAPWFFDKYQSGAGDSSGMSPAAVATTQPPAGQNVRSPLPDSPSAAADAATSTFELLRRKLEELKTTRQRQVSEGAAQQK